jgi:hypothetical protein
MIHLEIYIVKNRVQPRRLSRHSLLVPNSPPLDEARLQTLKKVTQERKVQYFVLFRAD